MRTVAPSRARIVPFAVGTAGIVLLLFAYYAHTWHSIITDIEVRAQLAGNFEFRDLLSGATLAAPGNTARLRVPAGTIRVLEAIQR